MFDKLFSLFSHDIGIDLGPRIVLPFALLTIRNAAHGATLTGRAVIADYYA